MTLLLSLCPFLPLKSLMILFSFFLFPIIHGYSRLFMILFILRPPSPGTFPTKSLPIPNPPQNRLAIPSKTHTKILAPNIFRQNSQDYSQPHRGNYPFLYRGY
jgi:hypothetical protein